MRRASDVGELALQALRGGVGLGELGPQALRGSVGLGELALQALRGGVGLGAQLLQALVGLVELLAGLLQLAGPAALPLAGLGEGRLGDLLPLAGRLEIAAESRALGLGVGELPLEGVALPLQRLGPAPDLGESPVELQGALALGGVLGLELLEAVLQLAAERLEGVALAGEGVAVGAHLLQLELGGGERRAGRLELLGELLAGGGELGGELLARAALRGDGGLKILLDALDPGALAVALDLELGDLLGEPLRRLARLDAAELQAVGQLAEVALGAGQGLRVALRPGPPRPLGLELGLQRGQSVAAAGEIGLEIAGAQLEPLQLGLQAAAAALLDLQGARRRLALQGALLHVLRGLGELLPRLAERVLEALDGDQGLGARLGEGGLAAARGLQLQGAGGEIVLELRGGGAGALVLEALGGDVVGDALGLGVGLGEAGAGVLELGADLFAARALEASLLLRGEGLHRGVLLGALERLHLARGGGGAALGVDGALAGDRELGLQPPHARGELVALAIGLADARGPARAAR